MRELDLLLGRWLERDWPEADAGQRNAFEQLLDEPDPQIAAWLFGGTRPDDRQLAALIDDILAQRN